MEEILTYIKQNKVIFIVFLLITLGGAGYFLTHQTPKTAQNNIRTEASPVKKIKEKTSQPAKTTILAVDVQGAVKNSGVYRVKTGAIVQEVLQMAGGLQANADLKQINQAQ